MTRLIMVAALAALALLAPPGAPRAHAQQTAAVGVDAVRIEPLSQTVPVIGRLVARQSGIVAARIGGPVADMRVSVGDRVKKGDVLAILDTARLERQRALLAAEVAETTALIKLAEALLDLRRQELARLEGLRNSAAFSKGRHEDTRQQVVVEETSVGAAMARKARAEANLALAEIDLYYAQVRAPYDGVVTLEHTETGSWVMGGGPVVSMVGDRQLEIEADVPATRIPALEPGMVVSIALDDGTQHQAVVRAIVPQENPMTRTRQVRFTPDIEMMDRRLAVNESVVLQLPLGPYREVITVHKDAVITRQGQTFVYVAADGKANKRPVQTGMAVGGRFEVISGVASGELTVIRGNERLRPGQDVTIAGAS
ncbi:MAG: efflux RND transporter periplasmic adaptor subunit [Alphaproteobacteria bacterium]